MTSDASPKKGGGSAQESPTPLATPEEVLEVLTRILRQEVHEPTKASKKTTRSFLDDQGKKVTETVEEPVTIDIPPKIGDVMRAAELLGKGYGLFTDRVRVDGEGESLTVIYDYRDREDEGRDSKPPE